MFPDSDLSQQNLAAFVANAGPMTRSKLLQWLLDPRGRNLNADCGYPDDITLDMLWQMYDREGIGRRVVRLIPEECWESCPEYVDVDDEGTETDSENVWDDLVEEFDIYHYMERVDTLAGIGRCGLLYIGIDDKAPPSEPVQNAGFPLDGQPWDGKWGTPGKYGLLYHRVFHERQFQITKWEQNPNNPRFRQPVEYSVIENMVDDSGNYITSGEGNPDATALRIHWSRVLHVPCDQLDSSEIFGVPRQHPVFNRLLDIRKEMGGSAEMLWRGGFPGYSLEVAQGDPEMGAVQIDAEATRQQMLAYGAGLQRYLLLENMAAKSLQVQVADPTPHVMIQLKNIAFTLGIPWRKFMGSEEAKLAADADTVTFNKRMMRRQKRFINPRMLNPYARRIQQFGAMPLPTNKAAKFVWPDLNTASAEDAADIAMKRGNAIANWQAAGGEHTIPAMEFWTNVMGYDSKVATAIVKATEKYLEENPLPEPDPNQQYDAQGNPVKSPANPTQGGQTPPSASKGTNPAPAKKA